MAGRRARRARGRPPARRRSGPCRSAHARAARSSASDAADRRADADHVELARRADEPDQPVLEDRVEVDPARPRAWIACSSPTSIAGPSVAERVRAALRLDDLAPPRRVRVAERRLEEEAVELRLRERERALVLERVLRREHEERVGQRVRLPSAVTWPSAIASSSADCVRGIARLISSTRRMFAKTGPGAELELPLLLVVDREPRDVGGLQVGRALDARGCAPSIDCAIARARTVFAVPGTSSMSTCPRQRSAQSTSRIWSRLPRTTSSTLSSSRSARAEASVKAADGSTCLRMIVLSGRVTAGSAATVPAFWCGATGRALRPRSGRAATMAAVELDRLSTPASFPPSPAHGRPTGSRREVDAGLGGVVVYGANITAAGGRLGGLTLAAACPMRDDLIVAIDEEAGDVTRLWYRDGRRYRGNLALGAVDDVALTEPVARSVAGRPRGPRRELHLRAGGRREHRARQPGDRDALFGEDTSVVARHGAAFVRGLQSAQGGAARRSTSRARRDADRLPPRPAGDRLRRGDAAHARARPVRGRDRGGREDGDGRPRRLPALDELPATLSRRITTGLLRDELGFDGVVATDALDMQAVARRYGIAGAAVRALTRGRTCSCSAPRTASGSAGRSARSCATRSPRGSCRSSARAVGRAGAELAAWARPRAGRRGLAGDRARGGAPRRLGHRVVPARCAAVRAGAPRRHELRRRRRALEPRGAARRLGFLAGSATLGRSSDDLLPCRRTARRGGARCLPQRRGSAPGRPAARAAARPRPRRDGPAYDRELAGERFVATYGAAAVNAPPPPSFSPADASRRRGRARRARSRSPRRSVRRRRRAPPPSRRTRRGRSASARAGAGRARRREERVHRRREAIRVRPALRTRDDERDELGMPLQESPAAAEDSKSAARGSSGVGVGSGTSPSSSSTIASSSSSLVCT